MKNINFYLLNGHTPFKGDIIEKWDGSIEINYYDLLIILMFDHVDALKL
jgi:hypothetical protein